MPKANWTAHASHAYPGAGAICQGCHLLVEGRCPDRGPSGKPLRWTLLTLATDGMTSRWASKADKRTIAKWVADPAVSVSVADQGKKHCAYMAPLARPGRVVVALDARRVSLLAGQWAQLATGVQDAYRAGVPKVTLATGLLDHRAHRVLGNAAADAVGVLIGPYQNTTSLALAVWLAQHEEEDT